ncbi:MAG TPA: DUF4097 family beta strand repeat-containing protein [Anaerovoracaceae bacterium]|nr:DUF4097 family beta strand repeat-containing protein [Anaerovoracaceae bacterium]
MNKSMKGIAIVAAAMVTVGILLTGIGYMAGGNQHIYLDKMGIHVGDREGGKNDGGELVSFSQNIGSFSNIDVDLDIYEVDLVPGEKFSVQGDYLSEAGKPTIQVENDTLVIKSSRNKVFNLNIDLPGLIFDNNKPNLKIYYPESTKLKDVVIRCDASDLSIEDLIAERAEFELDFGKLELANITADNITVDMDSGDCMMKNMKAADKLTITNNFGKTTLEGAEMKTLKVDADSGDVTLTDTTFDYGDLKLNFGKLTAERMTSNGLKVESDSGDVNLEGKLTGLIDVTCDMGKVTVNPGASRDQFNYELNADMGSVSIEGDRVSGSMAFENPSAKNTLKITTDMGDINVNFN